MAKKLKQDELTKPQAELLEAMKNGVVVHYMPYMGRLRPNPYYFRADTHKKCSAAAKALLDRGLVEERDRSVAGYSLVFKQQ
jgi:hypothetical protein